jgi:hypothetical protein
MSCRVAYPSKVIQAAARIHNFFIDRDKPRLGAIRLNADGTFDPAEPQRFEVEPLPVGDRDGHGLEGNLDSVGYETLASESVECVSARRQTIVNELAARDIRRPQVPG